MSNVTFERLVLYFACTVRFGVLAFWRFEAAGGPAFCAFWRFEANGRVGLTGHQS